MVYKLPYYNHVEPLIHIELLVTLLLNRKNLKIYNGLPFLLFMWKGGVSGEKLGPIWLNLR